MSYASQNNLVVRFMEWYKLRYGRAPSSQGCFILLFWPRSSFYISDAFGGVRVATADGDVLDAAEAFDRLELNKYFLFSFCAAQSTNSLLIHGVFPLSESQMLIPPQLLFTKRRNSKPSCKRRKVSLSKEYFNTILQGRHMRPKLQHLPLTT